MRRHTRTLAKAAFATVLGILSVPLTGFGEALAQGSAKVDQPFPPYNPYPLLPGSNPPSILPPDLQSEILRVRGEIQTIFSRYLPSGKLCRRLIRKAIPQPFRAPDTTRCGYSAVC
jgi:hypothetical protein